MEHRRLAGIMFREHLGLVVAVMLVSVIRPVPAQPAAVEPKAIMVRAARLLDVRAGRYVQDPVIVIQGARIKAAGAWLAVPAGVEVIDLGHAILLPGLIDCHTHLMGDIQWENHGMTLLTKSQAYRAL